MTAMRTALLALVVFSSACATRPPALLADSDALLDVPGGAALRTSSTAPAPMPLVGDDGYTKFSFGTFTPIGDIDGLDTGYYAQVAFGGNLIPLVSLEGSVGYFSADGPGGSQIAGVPLLLSASTPMLMPAPPSSRA